MKPILRHPINFHLSPLLAVSQYQVKICTNTCNALLSPKFLMSVYTKQSLFYLHSQHKFILVNFTIKRIIRIIQLNQAQIDLREHYLKGT